MHDNAKSHIQKKINQRTYYKQQNRLLFRNFETYRRNKVLSNSDQLIENIADFLETLTDKTTNKQLDRFIVHKQSLIDKQGD
ncbi:hypothetical protein TTHERM_000759190 (macronuclear) [Tetrahymena thermophila SB210]|uniref:Uncharacterized protein n=1 Tax=Tetrahymena thermophila (strain SB210) TaxID=312017 RepID=W7X4C7_TETTS|nr:hypothetical protein TTHERM_000759190 [Tetrahymena thermophila SB210]EWS74165.1 hypothetical protein TTHERM_000759190 [Tetrahymena thermophila SB210]|eukprot:XP_012653305.1 hypothetical protein TTHERM_000759190 [Tetrahymena thermophila SB210]